jgi:hypothetical protein
MRFIIKIYSPRFNLNLNRRNNNHRQRESSRSKCTPYRTIRQHRWPPSNSPPSHSNISFR